MGGGDSHVLSPVLWHRLEDQHGGQFTPTGCSQARELGKEYEYKSVTKMNWGKMAPTCRALVPMCLGPSQDQRCKGMGLFQEGEWDKSVDWEGTSNRRLPWLLLSIQEARTGRTCQPHKAIHSIHGYNSRCH